MEQVLDTPTASDRAPRSLALEAAGLGLVPDLGGSTETSIDRTILERELSITSLCAPSNSTETIVSRTISEREASEVSLFDELMRIRKTKPIQAFLRRLKDRVNNEGFPSIDVATRVKEVWREVDTRFGNSLPLPSIVLGEDGGVLFVWKRDPHYVEIEILPGGSEVFYENAEIGVASHKDVPSGESEVECAESWFLRFIDQQAGAYGTAA